MCLRVMISSLYYAGVLFAFKTFSHYCNATPRGILSGSALFAKIKTKLDARNASQFKISICGDSDP